MCVFSKGSRENHYLLNRRAIKGGGGVMGFSLRKSCIFWGFFLFILYCCLPFKNKQYDHFSTYAHITLTFAQGSINLFPLPPPHQGGGERFNQL